MTLELNFAANLSNLHGPPQFPVNEAIDLVKEAIPMFAVSGNIVGTAWLLGSAFVHAALQAVERVEEADGEGRTRTDPGQGGDVAGMHHFYTVAQAAELEAFPDGRVLNGINAVGGLRFRVSQSVGVVEKRGQIPNGNVAVFVDRGAEDRPAMYLERRTKRGRCSRMKSRVS